MKQTSENHTEPWNIGKVLGGFVLEGTAAFLFKGSSFNDDSRVSKYA